MRTTQCTDLGATSHRRGDRSSWRCEAVRRDDVTCTSHRHKEGDTNLDFELLKLCSFVSMCTSHIDADIGWMRVANV